MPFTSSLPRGDRSTLLLFLAPAIFSTWQAFADSLPGSTLTLPETVVTADRIETPLRDVGRSIEARSEDEIEAQQTYSLTQSLQTMSGVRPVDIGGPGAPGSALIEIRGFTSSGTQLLLDGMKLSDPSSISGTGLPLLPYLTVNDITSIEVLKGGTSVLYGSDGQGGAVNLLTKTPDEGTAVSARVQGGSFDTFEESADFGWKENDSSVFASLTRVDSAGLDTHGNYENLTGLASAQFAPSDGVSLKPIFRFVNGRNDLDSSPLLSSEGSLIPNQDSATNFATVASLFAGLVTDVQWDSDLSSKVSLYTNDNDRDYIFVFDGFGSNYRYRGRSYNADWQNVLHIDQWDSVLLTGAEYEHQSIDNDSAGLVIEGAQDRYALFLKNRVSLLEKSLQIDGGARLTHVSAIDRTLPSFEASGVYTLPKWLSRIHTSAAQGFRAPTLYETRGLSIDYTTGESVRVGNPDLREEEALSVDFGVEQPFLADKLTVDVTAFSIHAKHAILFQFEQQTHENAATGTDTRGVETSLTFEPEPWMLLRGAYTYLGTAESLDAERAQRRPYHSASTSLTAKFEPWTAFLQLRYRSSQEVSFFGTAQQYHEPSAVLIDASLTRKLSANAELFVRAENLLDKDWTEGGYTMPGISLFGGVRLGLHEARMSQ